LSASNLICCFFQFHLLTFDCYIKFGYHSFNCYFFILLFIDFFFNFIHQHFILFFYNNFGPHSFQFNFFNLFLFSILPLIVYLIENLTLWIIFLPFMVKSQDPCHEFKRLDRVKFVSFLSLFLKLIFFSFLSFNIVLFEDLILLFFHLLFSMDSSWSHISGHGLSGCIRVDLEFFFYIDCFSFFSPPFF